MRQEARSGIAATGNDQVSFWHISDLHFGRVTPGLPEALAAAINEAPAEAVIVSGDLTQAGRKREFAEAAAFLARLRWPVFVVPGNHDMPVRNPIHRFARPFARYREHIFPDLAPAI